ncbi:unnamed protein product, partial [Rotaria sp. Silwood1]
NETVLDDAELQSGAANATALNETENQSQVEAKQAFQSNMGKLTFLDVDHSIHGHSRIMSIKTEPPCYWRPRYKSDRKRQVEKSRTNPMEVYLPNLKECPLNINQSFWIELTMITTTNNPKQEHFIHTNTLEYHDDGVYQNNHASVRIPLTERDILKGEKK